MNTKVLGKSTKMLRLSVTEGNHEVLNLLVKELLKDSDVTFTAYKKEHELFENYTLIIRTKTKDPTTIMNKALKNLSLTVETLRKQLVSIVK
ncbi:MAG: hypothetical protein GON13_02830 [Nanoarchaeota archaeon]|nr:hypothetical protein [Nanoarchaeota archaeon]